VHLGNCIAVGKRKIPLAQFESKFVYEAGLKIDEDFDIQPAAIEEAKQLADICNEFSWKNNMHGSYLAGWIVDAIIGGSLKWRPHMFLTAGSGKGKSTVMNFIIKPILGSFCNKFIGPTSEAGFRQKNGSSSLAIFCDEFEGENDKQRAEIDKIFMLLRTASSQTDATITKGGKDGTPKSYALNGCCIMSGINVNLVKRADVTRHTVVTLDGKLSQEDFDKLNKCIVETVTPQYGAAIRARIIGMAHTIRANHDTFSKACAIRLGARLGDQIGALMAGYYALHSDKMITYDAAYKWVLEQDWSEYDEVQNQADEVDFMDYLVGLQVFCDSGKRRSIAELINIVGSSVSEYDTDNTESVDKKEAKNALGRYGLAVSAGRGDVPEGWIAVACKHPELAKLLSGTPWAVGWKHQLMRIEGVKTVKSWGFAGKITSCLVVPNIFTKQNSI
jgi:putative DNA primase/helicase